MDVNARQWNGCDRLVHRLPAILNGWSIRLAVALSLVMAVNQTCVGGDVRLYVQSGTPWVYGHLEYRREIVLPADPDGSRNEAPIFLDLTTFDGTVDLESVQAVEVTGGASTAIDATAYAEPTGDAPVAYWTAPGATTQNSERRFHVYYNKASSTEPYDLIWRDYASFGGSNEMVRDGSSKYYYYLRSDRLELKRGARNKFSGDSDPQHMAFYERNPDNEDFTHLKDRNTGFSPLDGIRMNYAFNGSEFTDAFYFNVGGEERSSDSIRFGSDGPTGAMCIKYTITDVLNHSCYETQRLFKDQPLMEFSVTTLAQDGTKPKYAADIYHSRQFYWKDDFDPSSMNTDIRGDEAIRSNSDVKTWHLLYENANEAIGVFTLRASKKQHWYNSKSLMDYFQLSADASNTLRVYYAVGPRDEILSLFRTMKRGYPMGDEQQQRFSVISPLAGEAVAECESIRVVVDGDQVGGDTILRAQFPDGSTEEFSTYTPADIGSSNAIQFDLGCAGDRDQYGTWNLSAVSSGIERNAYTGVMALDHPRAIFTGAELQQSQARWTTDERYQTHIKQKVFDRVSDYYGYGAVNPDDQSRSDSTLRRFSRAILAYASYLTMEPAATTYRDRMWQDFETISQWERWDPIQNECDDFRTDDVVRGELLQKMALVFDWHNADLTIQKRREYANFLADAAESIFELNLAKPYPVRWNNHNWNHNNRNIIQNAAVAVVERAVAPYIADSRRSQWREKLDSNFNHLMQTLASDGSDNSGYSYNTRCNFSMFLWTETQRLNGVANVYAQSQWFSNTSLFDLYGMIPGNGSNMAGVIPFGNGDNVPYDSHQMTMSLMSLRKDDPVAQWIAENSDYVRVGDLQPFWLDYGKPSIDPAAMPNWHYFPDRGIFVFRSDWNNDSMYFAAKCGSFWGGHEHPDLGTFVLYRNGFPYIAPAHYVNVSGLEDENIMLINDKGIVGREADTAYAGTAPPEQWGKMDHAFGSPDFFNIIANPTNAYEDGANINQYTREFVGFDSTIVMREKVNLNSSSTVRQLLHGYKTNPLAESDGRYDWYQYPTDQVFFKQGSGHYRMYPDQADYPDTFMTIFDRSRSSWSTTIEPWELIPSSIPGYLPPGSDRPGNSSKNTYQMGYQLERTASGVSSATSVQVFDFNGGAWQSSPWDSGVADDGVVLYTDDEDSGAKIKVAWPKGGVLDGSAAARGLQASAEMVMRNYQSGVYGGRNLEALRDQSAQGEGEYLILADHPVSIATNFAGGGREAWITTTEPTSIQLYHPDEVAYITMNGQEIGFARSESSVSFALPVVENAQILTISLPSVGTGRSNAAAGWMWYE